MSYTTFAYDNLQLDRSEVEPGDQIAISMDVTNTGSRTGQEVVQLYIRQAEGARSAMKLKGFKRLSLVPGECKTVTFYLHTNQLGLYNKAMRYMIQPGKIDLLIGRSAKDLPLTGNF